MSHGEVGFGSDHGRPLDSERHPRAPIYDEFAQHTLRQGESSCHFALSLSFSIYLSLSNMSTAPLRLLFLLYPSHPTRIPPSTPFDSDPGVSFLLSRAFIHRAAAMKPSPRKVSSGSMRDAPYVSGKQRTCAPSQLRYRYLSLFFAFTLSSRFLSIFRRKRP